MRLLGLFLLLALAVVIPFAIWGDFFQTLFSEEGSVVWLEKFGKSWAWLAGIALLSADLFLPIPGTMVISALGYFYGLWLGGIIGATGSVLAGLLAYELCFRLGRGAAERIAGKKDLEKGERIFGGAAGGWIVALSRWLPVMPEVIACLAGLSRMPRKRFAFAVVCGSLPLGFTFAAIGAAGHANPRLALILSAVVPPILWAIVRPFVMKSSGE